MLRGGPRLPLVDEADTVFRRRIRMIDEKDEDDVVEPVQEEVVPEAEDDAPEEPEPRGGAVTSYDPLQRYLAEIRRYPLLTREEEHDLAVEYKEKQDVEAAYRLVTANLRLVVMI